MPDAVTWLPGREEWSLSRAALGCCDELLGAAMWLLRWMGRRAVFSVLSAFADPIPGAHKLLFKLLLLTRLDGMGWLRRLEILCAGCISAWSGEDKQVVTASCMRAGVGKCVVVGMRTLMPGLCASLLPVAC